MRAIIGIAACLAISMVSLASLAQTWPEKPVRIIVPNSPGGGSDTIARGMIEPLAKALGQPVFVENRGGANGIIGTEACARTAPDGHTLCGTASGLIVFNMVMRTKLPYDSLRDLAPVIAIGFVDSVLAVHPSVSADTLQDLLAYAKSRPSTLNWGYAGESDTSFMYEEWLKRSKAASFYPVPYKSHAQANVALVAGETHVGLNSIGNLAPQIKAGRLRPLAVTTSRRLDWLPNVPTFEEEGIKLPLRSWLGYHYPIATPRPIVQRMNLEIRRIMDSPEFQKRILERVGVEPHFGSPEEFDAMIRKQIKDFTELAGLIELKPQ